MFVLHVYRAVYTYQANKDIHINCKKRSDEANRVSCVISCMTISV